jgi:hypothetical protein
MKNKYQLGERVYIAGEVDPLFVIRLGTSERNGELAYDLGRSPLVRHAVVGAVAEDAVAAANDIECFKVSQLGGRWCFAFDTPNVGGKLWADSFLLGRWAAMQKLRELRSAKKTVSVAPKLPMKAATCGPVMHIPDSDAPGKSDPNATDGATFRAVDAKNPQNEAIANKIREAYERKPDADPVRKWAIEKAAQCWCHPTTSHLVMQPELAEVFADALVSSQDSYEAHEALDQAGVLPNMGLGLLARIQHALLETKKVYGRLDHIQEILCVQNSKDLESQAGLRMQELRQAKDELTDITRALGGLNGVEKERVPAVKKLMAHVDGISRRWRRVAQELEAIYPTYAKPADQDHLDWVVGLLKQFGSQLALAKDELVQAQLERNSALQRCNLALNTAQTATNVLQNSEKVVARLTESALEIRKIMGDEELDQLAPAVLRLKTRAAGLTLALESIRTHGCRADTTPTNGHNQKWEWWQSYLQQADQNVRDEARRALETA